MAALLAASYSYSYSETIYGVTNNAAGTGLSWSMNDVLPDASAPHITLQVNGLIYRYTAVKDPETGMLVHVRNKDAIDGGYVFEETDDWSGLPGTTIQKFFSLPYTNSTRWGDGEIAIEGEGSVVDANVVYSYRMDIGQEEINCLNPMSSPDCPGFLDALRKYLTNLDNLSPDDPFYSEWVQAQLEKETKLEEETAADEENQEEEDLEKELSAENTMDDLIDSGQQAAMLAALTQVPKIETYYTVTIPGGEYQDTVILEDAEIPDNRRAMRSLARDETHRSMVRSQYDRNQ